ncbi:serine protease grass-like [Drosophila takahashii]|uniref:serine protease grass-like n=1 Tax=Drosophila takahashii TaxID=29030 RepID=UPI00389934E7
MKKVLVVIAILACQLLSTKRGLASLLEPKCVKSRTSPISSDPWMVRVLIMGESKCGGSLITSRFVLTALHCLSNDSMSVRLGESTRNPVGNFEFPVDGKWVPKKRDINLDDIGLLRMKIDVLLSDYIRPICLLYNEETPFKFQFKVTGWGMLENGEMGRILQNATVNRMYCTWIWFAGRDTSRICAGSQTSDSCAGYSGGPLSAEIDYHGEFRPMLYGIVSSGSKSCRGRGVYTYVSYYMNWITDLKNRHSNGTSSEPVFITVKE